MLAGDFLLSRACVALASLKNAEVYIFVLFLLQFTLSNSMYYDLCHLNFLKLFLNFLDNHIFINFLENYSFVLVKIAGEKSLGCLAHWTSFICPSYLPDPYLFASAMQLWLNCLIFAVHFNIYYFDHECAWCLES